MLWILGPFPRFLPGNAEAKEPPPLIPPPAGQGVAGILGTQCIDSNLFGN
jgi:hypothetical protein